MSISSSTRSSTPLRSAARYLTESQVQELLSPETALEALEAAANALACGQATNCPRVRVSAGKAMMHVLPAASSVDDRLGVKTYVSGTHGVRFIYTLFGEDGLRAVMDADHLGRIRTGAASAFATRLLAKPDARSLGIIGTGNQAFTQVQAIAGVRSLETVRIFGRNRENAEKLRHRIQNELGIAAVVCDTARSAVDAVSIVVTITSSREPVIFGEWIAAGTHVNAVGSNNAQRREIDAMLVERAAIVAIEDRQQAAVEAGDLLQPLSTGSFDFSQAVLLAELVNDGEIPYDPTQITLFESLGIGLWDLACATTVVDAAEQRGIGTELPLMRNAIS